VNSPYEKLVKNSDSLKLRQAIVEEAMFAMDSVCRLNPYSPDNLKSKRQAKVLVFTSTWASQYGQFDVDTLISLSGGKPLTVSVAQALLEEALLGGDNVNLGVWATELVANSGLYQAQHALLRGNSKLQVMTPEAEGDLRARFRGIVRQYRNSGGSIPMHALLLDDPGASVQDLKAEVDSLRASFSEDDMALAKVLAPDFRIIESTEAVCRSCYRLMRNENIFTHDIKFPSATIYRTEMDHSGTMVLVELSDKYLPESLGEFMDAFALKTSSFYVSDND